MCIEVGKMLCDEDAGKSDVVEKQSDVDICSEDGIKKVEIYRSSRSGECRKMGFFSGGVTFGLSKLLTDKKNQSHRDRNLSYCLCKI